MVLSTRTRMAIATAAVLLVGVLIAAWSVGDGDPRNVGRITSGRLFVDAWGLGSVLAIGLCAVLAMEDHISRVAFAEYRKGWKYRARALIRWVLAIGIVFCMFAPLLVSF